MDNFPQQTLARLSWFSLKERASYICSGDVNSQLETRHHDLKMAKYTHFTSPIRRYIDIVVHRLIGAMIDQKKCPYTSREVSAICKHCTDRSRMADVYEHETERLVAAAGYKETPLPVDAVVRTISDRGMQMNFYTSRFQQPARKTVSLNSLDLSRSKVNELEQVLFLSWQMRVYNASRYEEKQAELEAEESPESTGLPAQRLPATRVEGGTKHLNPRRLVCRIPIHYWQQMLHALQIGDFQWLADLIRSAAVDIEEGERTREYLMDVTSEVASGKITRHYRGFNLTINPGSILNLQLSSTLLQGLLVPSVQLLNATPTVSVCIQHQNDPINSFSTLSAVQASKPCYSNLQEYVKCWSPALAMEASKQAVHGGVPSQILEVPVQWNADGQVGKFVLKRDFCSERFLKFQNFIDEEDSAEGDYLCIRYRPGEGQASWIAHCQIREVDNPEAITPVVTVHFDIHETVQPMPPELPGHTVKSTVEWIPKSLPLGRMQEAIAKVPEANPLARDIALGAKPADISVVGKKEDGEMPPLHVEGLNPEPNGSQSIALWAALQNPYTLIQGPPGTGKTVTGVRLACLLAQRNRKLPHKKMEQPGEDPISIPAQVLYCGPSNKSVDVVAENLIRMKKNCPVLLRVYGSRVERMDFPLPCEPIHPRQQESTTESRSNPLLVDITLHYRIRQKSNPYHATIVNYDDRFSDYEDKLRDYHEKKSKVYPDEISEAEIQKYLAVVLKASQYEISKAEIILCTCITATAPKFVGASYFKQVIIDECGMCMEPESMVPIVSAPHVTQVVLLGDHQQLQPIINSRAAVSVGLNISLFERCFHTNNESKMLRQQYRMHKAIAAFPSEEFYGNRLECPLRSQQFQSQMKIWPGGLLKPIVFCHVEGTENSLPVSAAEGGQDSKSNLEEVNFVGQYMAGLLKVFPNQVTPKNLAVLAFYRSQCTEIKSRLEKDNDPLLKEASDNVLTVVKSQGSEWDYVIVSCVRSVKNEELEDNPTPSWMHKHLGIVADPHQINVAITRAKLGLIIVGNANLLAKDQTWSNLLRHYQKFDCLVYAEDFLFARNSHGNRRQASQANHGSHGSQWATQQGSYGNQKGTSQSGYSSYGNQRGHTQGQGYPSNQQGGSHGNRASYQAQGGPWANQQHRGQGQGWQGRGAAHPYANQGQTSNAQGHRHGNPYHQGSRGQGQQGHRGHRWVNPYKN